MPIFTRNTITTEGAQLAMRSLTGNTAFTVTALAIGNGVLNDADSPESFATLKNELLRLPLSNISYNDDLITASAQISTATISESFVHTEMGLYSGDTLVAYAYAEPEQADFIPAAGGSTAAIKTVTMRIKLAVGQHEYSPAPTENLVSMEEMQTFVSEALPGIVEDTVNISQYQKKTDSTWSKIAGGGTSDINANLSAGGCRRFLDNNGYVVAEFSTYGQTISHKSSTDEAYFSLYANQDGINLYRGSESSDAQGIRITDAGTQFFQGASNFCTFQLASGQFEYTMPDRSGTLALEVVATHDRLGMVLTGSEFTAQNTWPYHVGVGVNSVGRLMFNLRHGGRLRYEWQSESDHSQGYHLYFDGEDTIADFRDLYELTTHITTESDNQANVYSFTLDPAHSPTGTLLSIGWKCRAGSGFSGGSVYLVVMARSSLGVVRHVATSKAPQIQSANKDLLWIFPRVELDGEELIIGLSTEAGATEIDTSLILGIRSASNPAGENNSLQIASGNISGLAAVAITSGTPLFAPISHVSDDSRHLTDDDREALANLHYTPNARFEQDENANGSAVICSTGTQPVTMTIAADSITINSTTEEGEAETAEINFQHGKSGTVPLLDDERLAKLDAAIDAATAANGLGIEERSWNIENWGDVVPSDVFPKTGGIIHVNIMAEAPENNNVLCSLFDEMPITCQFCHVVIVSSSPIVYPGNKSTVYTAADAGKLFAGTLYRHPLYDSGEKTIIANITRF